jgi:hypothetical protein
MKPAQATSMMVEAKTKHTPHYTTYTITEGLPICVFCLPVTNPEATHTTHHTNTHHTSPDRTGYESRPAGGNMNCTGYSSLKNMRSVTAMKPAQALSMIMAATAHGTSLHKHLSHQF